MTTGFTPPSPEELDALFPAYHVEKFIAQGGMGAVYLARQISLDRPVAIKILPEEFGDDADYRHSFETEAKAMAKLNHTNLVGVYDFGNIDDLLYIIMEFVPGRSLYETAHKKSVDEREAARLISAMCHGLEHAHSAGMLHRDIKPANVLIDDEARPKIVDFGLARPIDDSYGGGVVFGTPGYTAPEVVANPNDVDARADIFSVGAMLYELLTGQMPPSPYIPASTISDSDPAFDTIILKALHPQRDFRYPHAGEMADELDQLAAQLENRHSAPATTVTGAAPAASRLITSSQSVRPATVVATAPVSVTPAAAGLRPVSPSLGRPMMVQTKSSNSGLIITLLVLGIVIVGGILLLKKSPEPTQTPPQQKQSQSKKGQAAAQQQLAKQREEQQRQKQQEQRRKEHEQRLAEEDRQRAKREARAEREEREDAKKAKAQRSAAAEIQAQKEAEAARRDEKEREKLAAFDHLVFLKELRKKVTLDAAKKISPYNEALSKNVERYIREAKREVRRLDRKHRSKAERQAEPIYKSLIKKRRLPSSLKDAPEPLRDALDEYLDEQKEIDRNHTTLINSWRSMYTLAIEKQITELDDEINEETIEYLNAEIELAKAGNDHILTIARGLTPPEPVIEKEKDKKKDKKKDK